MIKKNLFALCAVLFATTAIAQSGLTCDDPIFIGKNYEGRVDAPGTVWYTANTYDLPLHVYFVPDSAGSKKSPEIFVDFTCEPGKYDDPALDNLLNKMSIFGVGLPIEFGCDPVTYQGRNAWELSISNSYREQLSESGITYNVPAYVQVNFHETGIITMTPDTVFASCIENSKPIKLGDTLDIVPNDNGRTFVLPYTDWSKDSIRYVWIGEESARVWLATDECSFTPDTASSYVWGYYDVSQDQPYKLQVEDVKAAIKDAQNGGLFYCKIIAPVSGKLVVEVVPETPPAGGAILMEYDEPVTVKANTTDIFAFPKTWNAPTMFQPSTICDLQMQVSNSHLFNETPGVFVSTFSASTFDEYALHITSVDMNTMTGNASDKFLYVRFISDKDITITPHVWDVSPCVDKSKAIVANTRFYISSSTSSTYFRLRYSEYSGHNLIINWEGSSRVTCYIGDTCQYVTNSSNARVVHYKAINKKTAYEIPAATVDSWASRVDSEGHLYVRFSGVNGYITFKTEKPAVEEPELPVDSALLNTVELKVGDNLNVALDSVFTIYRINYAEWLSTGATLTWTGSEPLHVFVAETYQFAVAPYNKYVHAYVPVPAGGGVVFDKNMLEALKDKVGENGYLYVRLLTEFPGNLSVK